MSLKDPIKRAAYYKSWYKANRASQLAYDKQYRAANSEKCLATQKAWRIANPELRKAGHHRWYLKHKDKINQKAKQWKKNNRAKYLEGALDYYYRNHELNKVKARAIAKRIWRTNPEYKLRSLVRAKARRKTVTAVTIDFESVKDFYKFVREQARIPCNYCGKMLSGAEAHIDHIVPIARGGTHEVDNLCAACPGCNLNKKHKLISEWRPELLGKVKEYVK